MKKYFVYELKKSLFVMFALAIIATAVYVIALMSQLESIYEGIRRNIPIDSIIFFGAAFSVIVPIWKLGYLMKKRSVDLYYSLPLSHARILAVKYLVGLIVVFVSFTLAYWIGSISIMVAAAKYLKCVNFIPLYFSALIPIALTYTLTAFIFTRANRFIDGVAFVIMTGMSLAMVVSVISFFTGKSGVYINTNYYTPFVAFSAISSYFEGNLYQSISTRIILTAADWVGLFLVAALGVAAGIGLFISETKVKAENCEQISESYFGYKVMIPLYAFSLALLSYRSLLLIALIAAAAYAVSVLYKRTPKIGWRFAVVVGVAIIAGAALNFIF